MKILSLPNNLIFNSVHNSGGITFCQNNVLSCSANKKDSFVSKESQELDFAKIYKSIEPKLQSTFSSEDMKKIALYTDSFKDKNLLELKTNMMSELQRLSAKLYYQDTPSTRKELSVLSHKLRAVNDLLHQDNPKFKRTKYSDWNDTSYGEQILKISHSRFEHPFDKAVLLQGVFTDAETKKKNRLAKYLENLDTSLILKINFDILRKMNNLLNSKNSDLLGVFSDKELKHLRNLAIHYYAFNSALKERGIHTHHIERVMLDTKINTGINVGDYVNGIGLVVNRSNFMFGKVNVPTITTFSFDKNQCYLKMYNLKELASEIPQMSLDTQMSAENINLLNDKAKEFIDKIEYQSFISEIRFMPLSNERNKFLLKYAKPDEIEKMKQNLSQGCFYVTNFLNKNPEKYPNSGKYIGIQLLDLLHRNNAYPIFARALAYEHGKRSPVNMYRRIGFIPYSHSLEDIKNLENENGGKFPIDVPVYLYFRKTPESTITIEKIKNILKNAQNNANCCVAE